MLKLPSLKKWKTACIAMASLAMLFGGSPGPVSAESQTDAMTLFKEAYLAEPEDHRIVDVSIDFFGPDAHLDMDAKMQALSEKSLCCEGRFNFDYTEPKTKKTSSMNVPFYLDLNEKNLLLYTKLGDQWSKLSIQGMPAELASSSQAVSEEALANVLPLVKAVSIINETEKLQAIKVVLDVPKLTQFVKDCDTSQEKTAQAPEFSPAFWDSLISYLQGQELAVDWIVDRNTHETITTSIDFTPLMRAYAQGALDAMAKGTVTFTEEQKQALETLGYFSELKFYLTTPEASQGRILSVPKEVRKTAVDSPFQGILPEITTSTSNK